MQLLIASDLHLDFWTRGYDLLRNTMGADVVVVAGDLAISSLLTAALKRLDEIGLPVVVVLGNHDYIQDSKENVESRVVGFKNIHWLNKSSTIIGGQRFLGGTLWYKAPPNDRFFDFRQIPDFTWYQQECQETLDYILEEAGPSDIVVTHHMPTFRSCHPKWRNAPSNPYFICHDAEPVLEATSPAMWIHGHTHESMDYIYGKTRIVCNPCGYPGENPGWGPKLVSI